MREQVNKFGWAQNSPDMPGEARGNLPTPLHYDIFTKKAAGAQHHSFPCHRPGELLAYPLQMANLECIIATRLLLQTTPDKGYRSPKRDQEGIPGTELCGIDSANFEPVINGMQEVVEAERPSGRRYPALSCAEKQVRPKTLMAIPTRYLLLLAPREHPKIASRLWLKTQAKARTGRRR